MSQGRVISYAGVQPQAGKCQTKGFGRHARHAYRIELHSPTVWMYNVYIYSPQESRTKDDIAVYVEVVEDSRLVISHFLLDASFLLPIRSSSFPYLPSNCCMDGGEKCFIVN